MFHGRLPVAVVLARDGEGREGQRQRTVPLGRNLLNLLKRNIVSNLSVVTLFQTRLPELRRVKIIRCHAWLACVFTQLTFSRSIVSKSKSFIFSPFRDFCLVYKF